ncbi:uncharacterized protein LOC110029556 isoform X2 [Phalaenopsis equestris]|uniref:uncharacterized protein LOC110029556 isoform X2 n=1 Tax=Phalaenopsis equestris TaxID=78828 RepID=UPI0009E20391|nr:uncharacterized protein LOC110029556 isoform X2 [Phalaenopsis equestris]
MPGPGPHIMYALGAGTGLMRLSNGRFTPQHCLFYAANAFLGPDLGSFAEWLASFFPDGSGGRRLGDLAMELIHHPFYYILLLGFPLSFFYAWLSRVLLQKGLIDTISGVALSRKQCFCLVAAGSLSHFFLDHLFELRAVRVRVQAAEEEEVVSLRLVEEGGSDVRLVERKEEKCKAFVIRPKAWRGRVSSQDPSACDVRGGGRLDQGKWSFLNVYMDIEYRMVGRPSPHKPEFCAYYRILVQLFDFWIYLYQ